MEICSPTPCLHQGQHHSYSRQLSCIFKISRRFPPSLRPWPRVTAVSRKDCFPRASWHFPCRSLWQCLWCFCCAPWSRVSNPFGQWAVRPTVSMALYWAQSSLLMSLLLVGPPGWTQCPDMAPSMPKPLINLLIQNNIASGWACAKWALLQILCLPSSFLPCGPFSITRSARMPTFLQHNYH